MLAVEFVNFHDILFYYTSSKNAGISLVNIHVVIRPTA